MKRELGIARCGLACCLCSENVTCNGCYSDNCPDYSQCENRKCSIEKGFQGSYKENGILDEIYGSLEHYFPGIRTISDNDEEKLLSVFRELNEDSRDIIKGEIKKVLRSQRYEESVAADEPKKVAK